MTAKAEQTSRHAAVGFGRDSLKHDVPAGVVVFLVALPLCLGIALASGAPLFSGLITGICGGLVVSVISKSPLSVSGPAAGLTVLVLAGIQDLGFAAFAASVVLSGVFQFILGMLRAGIIAYYFPVTVIKGLLAAIGAILILKQIPHAFGYDADYEGDMDFEQADGMNTFTEIPNALGHFHLGATIIAFTGLAILILWERNKRLKSMTYLPAPLIVVLMGLGFNYAFEFMSTDLAVRNHLLVNLPVPETLADIKSQLQFPDFGALSNPKLWTIAGTIAVIASIETLLCIEAVDKLDPFKRTTPASHELKAQGIGNIVAGLLGGIPMTAVIVRGSANVQSGGRTWKSAFTHGLLLLLSVLLIPHVLNLIPLAALAAILLHIGYKLARAELFIRLWRQGTTQFVPFIVTFGAIVFTDLLKGVAIGMATGIFFILREHVTAPYYIHELERIEGADATHPRIRLELAENVSFLNKAALSQVLQGMPDNAIIEIDASTSRHVDRDVLEILHEFREGAPHRGQEVFLLDVPGLDPDAPVQWSKNERRKPNVNAPSVTPTKELTIPPRRGQRPQEDGRPDAGLTLDARRAP